MATNHTRGLWARFSQSTRLRVLALLVILTTSTVFSLGYLSMRTVIFVGERAQAISGDKLDAQIAQYLRQVNSHEILHMEQVLRRVEHDVVELSFYTASFFATESDFAAGAYWDPEEQMFFGAEGQYINGADGVSSVYLPNFVEIDAAVMDELRRTAYLDPLFAAISKSNPEMVAIFIVTERDVTRYYPNINLGTLLPPDFDVKQRPWYYGSIPTENPAREVQWTDVYTDATGKGLLVTASAPVYVDENKFVGAVGIDLLLTQIGEHLVRGDSEAGYALLLDEQGRPVVLSEQGYQDILGHVPSAAEARIDLRTTETEFAPLLKAMVAGEVGYTAVQAGGRELLVAYAPLENNTGWSLANIVESQSLAVGRILQEEMEELVRNLTLFNILPFGGGVLLFILLAGSFIINRLTAPLEEIVAVVRKFEMGDWDISLPETRSAEINRLAQTLDTMRMYVQETMNTLEEQVAERTRKLEERTAQFHAIAELSQALVGCGEMQEVLDTAVDFISERFEVYHVGIFLQDDTGAWMLLRAASSEGDGQLRRGGYKLRIGGESIIGYVSSTARPRIALDVGEDAVRFDSPELPQTRSELALPLLTHGELIGALDLQSVKERAFSAEDADALRVLTDGLAISIEKAQLMGETGKTVERLKRYQEQEAISGWYRILARRQREVTYTYDRVTVEEGAPGAQSLLPFVQGELTEVQVRRVDDRHFLLAPIRMQQQTLGVLTFTARHPWSRESQRLVADVVAQLALALDNARLLEGTRLRASRERARSEIVSRVRDSVQVEAILRSAVEELGRSLQVDRVRLQLVNLPPGAADEK
ncbi:MAG: GAF domain-containing protein [Anaerolineae bacterium]|nr:GAF domain-containing protein [Anaerolineae bacterium]